MKISEKGQISVPFDIREAIGLERGDDILIIQKNDAIVLEKVSNVVKDKFDDLLKHSEKVAKKLWDNKFDEVWNNVERSVALFFPQHSLNWTECAEGKSK